MSSVFSLTGLFVPAASPGNARPALWLADKDGGYRDVSADWFDGHPDVADDTAEVTGFADAGHRAEIGLADFGANFRFFMNPGTAGTSAWEVLVGLKQANSTARQVIHYPQRFADTEVSYPARCVRVSVDGALDEAETFEAEFEIDGTGTIR